jgi:hypothetical protein
MLNKQFNMLSKFIQFNRYLSKWITPVYINENLFECRIQNLLNPDSKVLEIGGAERPYINLKSVQLLIGCDPDPTLLITNQYHKFYNGTIRDVDIIGFDLIVSRYVLEHVEDCKKEYLLQIEKLSTNGKAIHIYPMGFHPFSIMSKFFEHFGLKKKIISILRPDAVMVTGYKTYYDLGLPKDLECFLKTIPGIKYNVNYEFGAIDYFGFFFPFALIIQIFNSICRFFNLTYFASNIYVEITKVGN